MKFGLLFEVQRVIENGKVDENALYRETLDQCEIADEMGFDQIWFVEHHFLTGFSASPCPEILIGAVSQRTKRIRIGFGVVILPYHHPIRVAERVAMADQLTNGRIDLGTGRSNAYEQVGQGIDPRETRDMWEESIKMIPQIWQSEEFSWEGRYWTVPKRRILPKPYQQPHPPIWLACLQTSTYDLAAERGVGVLSSNFGAPELLEEHVKSYRKKIRSATPVGAFVNEQWANNTFAYCGEDNREARELCAESLKVFFGPDKPYTRDRVGVYDELLKAWGGVPDHLKAQFARFIKDSEPVDENITADEGINADASVGAAQAVISQLDADTLCDRAVIIAGDPDSCITAARKWEAIGVDQVTMMMQTETVPHEKVMKSLEMFGKHVLPAFRQTEQAKARAAT